MFSQEVPEQPEVSEAPVRRKRSPLRKFVGLIFLLAMAAVALVYWSGEGKAAAQGLREFASGIQLPFVGEAIQLQIVGHATIIVQTPIKHISSRQGAMPREDFVEVPEEVEKLKLIDSWGRDVTRVFNPTADSLPLYRVVKTGAFVWMEDPSNLHR